MPAQVPALCSQRPEAGTMLQMSLKRLRSSEVSYETSKKLPARLRSLAATLWCCCWGAVGCAGRRSWPALAAKLTTKLLRTQGRYCTCPQSTQKTWRCLMRPLRSSLHVSEALQPLCGAVDRGLSRRCAGDAAAKLNTKPSPEAEAVLHNLFSSRKFGGV